jgi:hypothetical protein
VQLPSLIRATLLILSLLLTVGCRAHPVTLIIERDEIQRRVETKFPIEKQVLVARVVLEHPQVILREGSDRIGLELRVRAQAPLVPAYGGTVAVTGKLAYRREDAAFTLREPAIERLELEGLRPEHAEVVRRPVEAAVQAALETVPVYRLEGKNLKEIGARHLLDSVVVRDGKLHVTLALGEGSKTSAPASR